MRYIDSNRLRLPDGWLSRAATAAAKVAEGADPNDFGDVWRELKSAMLELSCNKCWYCESPSDRADNAVDHFRPKNAVKDAANPHQGYRWLAFEATNYRLACTYCNSKRIDIEHGTAGGKADRFPLLNEEMRVYFAGSVVQEEPELLDPCEIDDCELIGCMQENGKPCSASEHFPEKKRATTSIEIYHLDRDATCKLRHADAAGLISDIIEAKRRFELAQKDTAKRNEFVHVIKRIQRRISTEARYSGEMRYLLRGQRSEDHPWIRRLLEA